MCRKYNDKTEKIMQPLVYDGLFLWWKQQHVDNNAKNSRRKYKHVREMRWDLYNRDLGSQRVQIRWQRLLYPPGATRHSPCFRPLKLTDKHALSSLNLPEI